jgi:hypothetical protein
VIDFDELKPQLQQHHRCMFKGDFSAGKGC